MEPREPLQGFSEGGPDVQLWVVTDKEETK